MNFKNEKQIILVIRYTLPIFIICLSLVVTTFLYFENKTAFEKIRTTTEDKFISDKKLIIKEQVDSIYSYIISEQADTEKNLKKSLKSRIYEAHKTIVNLYHVLKKEKTKEEIIPILRAYIKDIRFNENRGYFFIYDMQGNNIIHALLPQLQGKNLLKHKDARGEFALQKSIDLLQDSKESYQEWYWKKSANDPIEYKKIGFIKRIEELNWFIGTGEYVQDFSQNIKNRVIKQVKKFKFEQDGYMFIIDQNNLFLSHVLSDKIGKSAFNPKNIQNMQDFIQNIKEATKNKGGYVSYVQNIKPSSKKPAKKTSYVKPIPHWKWVIGTGFYEDNVDILINHQQKILQSRYSENLKNIFIISLIMTFTLLILSFYISYIIEKKFKRYKQDIEKHIEKNHRQHELLAQKSKLSAMGEMMENIAHQWRQPLSVITIAASGIRINKELNSLDDNLLDDSLNNISLAANHLSETIDDFRDFFRTDKEEAPFYVDIAIKKSLKLLSSSFHNREIQVFNHAQELEIIGYERDLLQVFLNLLNNAKDALQNISTKRYIFIEAYINKDTYIITVKDNAGGVKEKILDRIFEPYFTTKHKSIGTGIGLYMSQEIIHRHMKGSITVQNDEYTYENEHYKGALFTITLPK